MQRLQTKRSAGAVSQTAIPVPRVSTAYKSSGNQGLQAGPSVGLRDEASRRHRSPGLSSAAGSQGGALALQDSRPGSGQGAASANKPCFQNTVTRPRDFCTWASRVNSRKPLVGGSGVSDPQVGRGRGQPQLPAEARSWLGTGLGTRACGSRKNHPEGSLKAEPFPVWQLNECEEKPAPHPHPTPRWLNGK